MPTVLIVDDSLSVRKVAERMLKEAGFEVDLAANGEAALAWLSTHQPDLVIADVIMPDMSGFEVCAFIRTQARMATMPVLLFSGFVDDDVTRKAAACKADGVVKKPFQAASLCEQVMALLAARAPQGVRVESLAPERPVPAVAMAVPKPPSPAPVWVATPTAAAQVEGEQRMLREAGQRLEISVAEQAKRLAELERQVQDLHHRLAEEEKRTVELRARLAGLEPAVAASTHLLQALTEFARQALKSPERGRP